MDVNIIKELKQFDILIGKQIFEMNKENVLTKHPSPLQISVIKILLAHENEDISQNDLKDDLHISKAAMSEVLQVMEKKGMIKRIQSSTDARKNKIILSDEGRSTFEEIEKDMIMFNAKVTRNISSEEINLFIQTLKKMKENIRKEGE